MSVKSIKSGKLSLCTRGVSRPAVVAKPVRVQFCCESVKLAQIARDRCQEDWKLIVKKLSAACPLF